MKRTALKKIGRTKKDPLNGGFNDHSGFWGPVLRNIGRKLISRGATTRSEWDAFAGPDGDWQILKSFACEPDVLLDPTTDTKNRNWRDWLCRKIARQPVLVPLFLGMMREQVQSMSHIELWLFYGFDLKRHLISDEELSAKYQEQTHRICSVAQMTQARENIYRRIKRKIVSRKRPRTKRESMS